MNLYAFWALQGYKLSDLTALTEAEKIFLSVAREINNEMAVGERR